MKRDGFFIIVFFVLGIGAFGYLYIFVVKIMMECVCEFGE